MLLKPPVEAWTSSYLLDPVHVPEDPPKQYPPKQIQVLHAAQVAHSALLLHPENDVTVHQLSCPTKNPSFQTQPCPPTSNQTSKPVNLGIPGSPLVGTHTSTAEGWGSVPGQGTKTLQAAQDGRKLWPPGISDPRCARVPLSPEDPVRSPPSVAGSSCCHHAYCRQTGHQASRSSV